MTGVTVAPQFNMSAGRPIEEAEVGAIIEGLNSANKIMYHEEIESVTLG
jgi:hypothetical protein